MNKDNAGWIPPTDSYTERIEAETGRAIVLDGFTCEMCQGRGYSQVEEICTNCVRGEVTEYRFNDFICSHQVPLCDCDFITGPDWVAMPGDMFWLGVSEYDALRTRQLGAIMDQYTSLDDPRKELVAA